MSNKYGNNPGMENNHERNKEFNNAAKNASLTKEEKQLFSKILHEDKNYDREKVWTYQELFALAKAIKEKKV